MATTNNSIIVAMVPFSRFTHINQLFILARIIASHNIPVHLLCLPEFNKDLKSRLEGEYVDIAKNIYFNDILLSQAKYCGTAEDCDDDERVLSIMELLEKHSEPIQKTCLELSTNTKKLVIIYDSIMKDFLGDVHSYPNVETCIFHSGSAISKYSLLRQSLNVVVGVGDDGDDHEKLLKQLHEEFPAMDSCFPPGMEVFEKDLYEWDLNSGEFMISSREVEGKYLDLLAKAKNKKPLWAFGPLHMLLQSRSISSSSSSSSRGKDPHHECIEFLDNQDVNSVIYISFGTGTILSREQINELAFGLEKSNQRFIWVIGKGDHSNTNDNNNTIELPQGFEERVKGRGMAVRNWVPQLEILGHPSTGGFLSHCGWNSCMESISLGVPIIAWPNEWDQPYNAILVTKVLKIGIPLSSGTLMDELITSKSIEKYVKVLMDTTEGKEMRKRAVELSNKIKSSVSPGGVTAKEVESFISYITK